MSHDPAFNFVTKLEKIRACDGGVTVSDGKVRHAVAPRRDVGMRSISRRALLTSATALCGLRAARAAPALVLNDASRLNPIPIAGHAIVRDGVAVSLAAPLCEPNPAKRTYRVRGGVRWSEVIQALDPLGFSVAVMQSNHDFSVAGTLSVNAHGWPVPFGPFGSTVRGLRLMLADGTVVTCSRSENPELFALAIGGYGLFGIVIDAELDVADNVLLAARHETMPAAQFAARFIAV